MKEDRYTVSLDPLTGQSRVSLTYDKTARGQFVFVAAPAESHGIHTSKPIIKWVPDYEITSNAPQVKVKLLP